jgi:hypothetical protein
VVFRRTVLAGAVVTGFTPIYTLWRVGSCYKPVLHRYRVATNAPSLMHSVFIPIGETVFVGVRPA